MSPGFRASLFVSNRSASTTPTPSLPPRQLTLPSTNGVPYHRTRLQPSPTSTPPWPGRKPALPCPLPSSVSKTTPLSDPLASLTWNDGRGRRPTRDNGHALDACEIGYTWLGRSAIRTAANTEAKLLLLTHAFETWELLRVCLHTDVRNQRSRAAIERIGGKFEGILRAHRMATDYIARDSARYSIVAAEWPDVKLRLTRLLDLA